MIRVLISDGNGTLALDRPSEAKKILRGLKELGIQLAVATNGSHSEVVQRFRNAGLSSELPDIIVTKADVSSGLAKPNPEFVYEIARQSNVSLPEIAFLGDDNKTDILCAINAGVLPLAARYSTASTSKELKYGLGIHEPSYLFTYLSLYCLQDDPYFGWTFEGTCPNTGKTIDARALINQHTEIPEIKQLLKQHIDTLVGPRKVSLQVILYHYLVTRIYLSGLAQNARWFTVYPSHEKDKYNAVLEFILEQMKNTFRPRFKGNLIQRHTNAPKSQYQSERDIYDQFRTIQINSKEKKHIEGNHILVLDDFTTTGHSFEVARRMLLEAGASAVTGLSIGKYRSTYSVTNISKKWDPFIQSNLSKGDIRSASSLGDVHDEADKQFFTLWEHVRKH